MGLGSVELIAGLLKSVSRSFYLTLRVLPGAVRTQIGLAYLLARASDTIADTDAVPKSERLQVLEAFRRRVLGESGDPLELKPFVGKQSSPAERVLLQRIEEAFALLRLLDPADQQQVRTVLEMITSGQALDVARFAEADRDHIAPLQTREQLDDYTYRVAGCVGEFWTHICRRHLFPSAPLDDALLLNNGVRFGKGLQMVNILRDLPADLQLGRCYLPIEVLSKVQLRPADLLDPAKEAQLRPGYNPLLELADEHLRAGWQYTNQVPFGQVRVRLACAWPVLIGAQTIQKLRRSNVLDASQRIKISRREVRAIMARTILLYPWKARWRALLV